MASNNGVALWNYAALPEQWFLLSRSSL